MIPYSSFPAAAPAGPASPTLPSRAGTPGHANVSPLAPWGCTPPAFDGFPRHQPPPLPGPDHLSACPFLKPAGPSHTLAWPSDRSPTETDDHDYLLRLYRRDALREPPLTSAEEKMLGWLCSFDQPAAAERLVLGSLRLVVRIAQEYRGLGLPLPDLISEGNLGLFHATQRFDPGQGTAFTRYATFWVRQRMRRALSYQAWPVRMPADWCWQHTRLRETESRLTLALQRAPAPAELAREARFSLARVARLTTTHSPCSISLDTPVAGEEDGQVLGDVLPDTQYVPPDEALARQSDRQLVLRLLASLKSREQQVLRLRYGFRDGREHTLEEVGRELGYVRQGIHRIESAALTRLRQRLLRLQNHGPATSHPSPRPLTSARSLQSPAPPTPAEAPAPSDRTAPAGCSVAAPRT
jgi:RNA polymerase primary sigma factor